MSSLTQGMTHGSSCCSAKLHCVIPTAGPAQGATPCEGRAEERSLCDGRWDSLHCGCRDVDHNAGHSSAAAPAGAPLPSFSLVVLWVAQVSASVGGVVYVMF